MYKNVIVIGCGGIGSHLLPPLTRFFASMEKEKRPKEMRIVDGDKYEQGNADRQEFVARQVNQNKAEAQKERCSVIHEGMMDYYAFPEYLGSGNIDSIIEEDSIIFMCVDNHVCRSIVSKHCQTLNNVALITGANELTDGNVQIYVRKDGKDMSPPIEKRHPEISTAKDGDRSMMSCEEIEKLPGGGQIILVNATAANLQFQLAWEWLSIGKLPFEEVYFDVESIGMRGVPNDYSKK